MADVLNTDNHNINGGTDVTHPSINGSRATRDVPSCNMLPDHLRWVTDHNNELRKLLDRDDNHEAPVPPVTVTGEHLTIAELVAVSCHKVQVRLSDDEKVLGRVNASVEFLKRHISAGEIVYGINTGFGGSADARSTDLESMQRGLIQHQNSGVLLPSDIRQGGATQSDSLASLTSHALPRTVVRGAMLTRINSLMRGHSGVRLLVIEALAELLNRDFIPVIPLRGSISASGDLMPLSYLAGTLEGNHDIFLDCTVGDKREIFSADKALQIAGIAPIVMQPKEALGLMNGTAVSCAAAALALHEAHHLALLAQTLTAMCTEALRGSADNFHPFISSVRPHLGQKEVAENILRQLKDSKLVVGKNAHTAGLYQDRYAIRTASQFLGPQLEDLQLATRQIEVELNSTTDNPLIDEPNGIVHHGGNFQAVSITSAMEKTRLALQMMGRLMFAQVSELINPALNNSLTPNLCFDDPDVSFTMKGVDINMAAYMSELAYLASPVSSHIQSAELHNQSVNSLALISARYTLDAVEIVSLMASAYLYAVTQGLDLHVLHTEYMTGLVLESHVAFEECFGPEMADDVKARLWPEVVEVIRVGLVATKSLSLDQRAKKTAEATIVPLVNETDCLPGLKIWIARLEAIIREEVARARMKLASDEQGLTTLPYLGHGSATMYRYVRSDLHIALHKGLVEHPAYPKDSRDGIKMAPEERATIGSRISKVYSTLRSGEMHNTIITSLA